MQPPKNSALLTYKATALASKSKQHLTDEEIQRYKGDTLIYDIEIYPNYFCIGMLHCQTEKVIGFEISPDAELHRPKLRWVLDNYRIVSFNGKVFDAPLLAYCLLNTVGTLELYTMAQDIIENNLRPFHVEKQYGIKIPQWDHIDLIEVAPLSASLKVYGGRMHCKRMQDLPYPPHVPLSKEQALETLDYCFNDLDTTNLLFKELEQPISLREKLGSEYKQDLRSRSDAQIAEYSIGGEIKNLRGKWPKSPSIEPGTRYSYNTPEFVRFQSETLRHALSVVQASQFVISEGGKLQMPDAIKALRLTVGTSTYQMGMGGLHSTESCVSHHSDAEGTLYDRDVASYYPRIILNQRLSPNHLGDDFLKVYESIVDRRLEAKSKGDKRTSDSLKIVINGSFGKLGNEHSILCSPDLLLQVTVTGQLSLLLLIERFELAGIPVVSANTDGLVSKVPADKHDIYLQIVKQWEHETQFETEETEYKSLYFRDVNNYIAIKPDGEVKTKGKYSEKGSALNSRLSKNPENLICNDAVCAFLAHSVPIEKTVNDCLDITRFVTVRTVKGGGQKDGCYLGKVVRWYYKRGEYGTINYCGSGNKVPRSEGGWPCMELPEKCPEDLDRKWYINEAYSILEDIGYFNKPKPSFLF